MTALLFGITRHQYASIWARRERDARPEVANPVVPLTPSAAEEKRTPDERLDALLQQYRRLVRHAILRICPRELGLSCEDIEQEAWLSIWRALKAEREIAFPTSYIYKVAVSATLRAIRRAKARREESLEDEGSAEAEAGHVMQASPASPEIVAGHRELRHKIELALEKLPENRRRAVEQHLDGLNTREIGESLGWSEPKARNLVHRGLKDLRKSLRELGIEYQP